MNSYKLTGQRSDGKEASVWACGVCGVIRGGSQESAETCCKCVICGEAVLKDDNAACSFSAAVHRGECDQRLSEQRAAERAARLQARIDKAEKLEAWDGWVCNEGFGGGPQDGYTESLDALVEWFEDNELDPADWPEWVFVCKPQPFRVVNVDHIIEHAMDPNCQEEYEALGVNELQAALDAFAKANEGYETYYPDYKRVVRVPKHERSQA